MFLSEALSEDVRQYLEHRAGVLIPIGSLEQHGNAAPLACDTIIPVKLCAEVERKTGIAVAPAISYGMSENHMGFPGTVTLKSSTLSLVVEDVALSLHRHGFRQIFFLSGHGGNRAAAQRGLDAACEGQCDTTMLYIPYWELPGVAELHRKLFCPDPGYHVTVTEVSMIWYLMGLDMPEFERVEFPPEPESGSRLSASEWKQRYPGGGAGSNLKYVSQEKGKELFSFMVKGLCRYIQSVDDS